MKLNGINKIDETQGRYIVLVNNHEDGLCVDGQYASVADAMQSVLSGNMGECSIVQLVDVELVQINLKEQPK